MAYKEPIMLSGDQVASLTGAPRQTGNPGDPDFSMVLPGVDALGEPDTVFRLVWIGNLDPDATHFANGQIWSLQVHHGKGDPATDPDGWTTVPEYQKMIPKNDLVSGLGAGDDHVVFDAGGTFLLFDTTGNLPTSPTDTRYTSADEDGDPRTGDNDGELDFADAYAARAPVCFCAGTRIATPDGPRAVERLVPGDHVITRDHGALPVRFVARSDVTLARTIAQPGLLPIRIRAGAMGADLPARDVWLSPQHRLLVTAPAVACFTGAPETLVAAKHLTSLPGIAQLKVPRRVTYHYLRLDRHALVLAEGIWAETLLLGRQAIRALPAAARRELRLLFPAAPETPALAARPVARGRDARRLARHLRATGLPLLG
jgi:hypothetical protein